MEDDESLKYIEIIRSFRPTTRMASHHQRQAAPGASFEVNGAPAAATGARRSSAHAAGSLGLIGRSSLFSLKLQFIELS